MSKPEPDEEMTTEEIQAELERERADSKAHGARLVETYRCVYEITEEDLADPDWMLAWEGAAKMSAEAGLEQAGYVATGEPTAEYIPTHFPITREIEDEDGNKRTITVVGAMYGQIKGYKP